MVKLINRGYIVAYRRDICKEKPVGSIDGSYHVDCINVSFKARGHQTCRSEEEYNGDSDNECNSGNDLSSTQKRKVVSRIKIVTRLRVWDWPTPGSVTLKNMR